MPRHGLGISTGRGSLPADCLDEVTDLEIMRVELCGREPRHAVRPWLASLAWHRRNLKELRRFAVSTYAMCLHKAANIVTACTRPETSERAKAYFFSFITFSGKKNCVITASSNPKSFQLEQAGMQRDVGWSSKHVQWGGIEWIWPV